MRSSVTPTEFRFAYVTRAALPSREANSIHVMKMAQAFVRCGLRLDLLAPDRSDVEQNVADVYEFYGVSSRFPIRKLPWPSFRGRAFIYAWNVLRHVLRSKYSPVYTRVPLCAAVIAWFARCPTVLELHSLPERRDVLERLAIWMFGCSARALGLVVISEALKADVERIGLCSCQVLVAADAADDYSDEVKPVLPASTSTTLRVGFAGHLYPGKGMEIVARLAPLCKWATFHIVGGSDADVARWRERIEAPNLIFHGFVPPSRVPAHLASMDILLVPMLAKVQSSTGTRDIARWTSPLKVLEYMAAAKPIVASNLPAIRELLEHGATALLCDPNELDEWVQALASLRDAPALREQLASRARETFLRRYTWSIRAKKIDAGLFQRVRDASGGLG